MHEHRHRWCRGLKTVVSGEDGVLLASCSQLATVNSISTNHRHLAPNHIRGSRLSMTISRNPNVSYITKSEQHCMKCYIDFQHSLLCRKRSAHLFVLRTILLFLLISKKATPQQPGNFRAISVSFILTRLLYEVLA